MARRKIPENETEQQKKIRQQLEQVTDHATRSEKTSWNRKMDKMVSLITKVKPIEQKIHELMEEKQPLLDEIQNLRSTMVKECIHPYEYLVLHKEVVYCKFCEKNMGLVSKSNEEK